MLKSCEFSVIIPTYNRLECLKQALGSVWAQSYTDFEIVVADDGSTDGTKDFLESLGDSVKVLRLPNKGPSAARNLAAKHSTGSYIALLDSDDVWFPWTLATFHELILSHQQPSLLCAAVTMFDGNLPKIEKQVVTAQCFSDYLQSADDSSYMGANALVIKKSIFDSVNGFDEKLLVAEDHDFCLRVGLSRGFVRLRTPVTLAYRRHGGNISSSTRALCTAAGELLTREVAGRYPGGERRKKERWQLLCRMLRPVAFSCLKAGLVAEGWSLYWRSFRMNARLGRFRFLIGFVLYSVAGRLTGQRSQSNSDVLPAHTRSRSSQ